MSRGAAASRVDVVVGAMQARRARHVWDDDASGCQALLDSLRSALLRFEAANDACQDLSENIPFKIGKAFLTFTDERSRHDALEMFPNLGVFTSCGQDASRGIDGKVVMAEPAPEPEEINFENVVVPEWNRLLRFIIATFLMVVFLSISYALIYQVRGSCIFWRERS